MAFEVEHFLESWLIPKEDIDISKNTCSFSTNDDIDASQFDIMSAPK